MLRPLLLIAMFAVTNYAADINLDLITDHSAATEACGPVAIRWGFMCPIVARHNDKLYALNFTRTPDVPWDTRTPIEAPVAFWSRDSNNQWHSILLDSPERTYQTPTLLLSPDGRAHVFTLEPGSANIQWFHATDPTNTKFNHTAIPMKWGSYMSGAINKNGLAALVYWGNSKDYPDATLACTLLDTTTGQSRNLIIDSPGAPYCYNQLYFNDTGLHILSIRSELSNQMICNTTNHYTDLRYYHCPDPTAENPKWQRVTVMQNEKACIQPLGNLVDANGRIHLLYQYALDNGQGKSTGLHLVYAASRNPITPDHPPDFVKHELNTPGDGRLFMTSDNAIHILAYAAGTTLRHANVLDPLTGNLSAWQPIETKITFSRIFPVDPRNGSTIDNTLSGLIIPAPTFPQQNSMYYFTTP